MQKKMILLAIAIVIIFSVSAPGIYAQTTSIVPSLSPTGKITRTQAWCNKIVPRIATLITNATNNLPQRQEYVAKRKQNLQDRINKLQQRGANVTQLTADFQTFSGMLDTWVTDFQTYIADLKATQQYSCGTSKGQFANAVKVANTARLQVRTDFSAFRKYYTNTLVVDFKTARQSVSGRKKLSPNPT